MLPAGRGWIALAAILLTAAPAWCEDSSSTRYYLDVRYGESNPLTRAHDVAGVSLGVNIGRYLGFELAADRFQLRLETIALGRVADLGVNSFTPQVRLRYPLLDDLLVPYVIGGTGVTTADVNDPIEPVTWTRGSGVRAVSTLGVGIEYFLRDNIAFGVEGKYFIIGRGRFTVDDEESSISLNTATMTFGFRLFYPELHPPEGAHTPARGATWRFYGAVRFGGALSTSTHLFPGITAKPADTLFDSNFSTLLGGAVGVDYGAYLGLEASFENYNLSLSVPDKGTIGKYAVFPILLQVRLRYPLMEGHLEPYVSGGAGAEVAEPDKPNANASGIPLSRTVSFAGSVGAGVQYFVMDDIAVGFEAKYILSTARKQSSDSSSEGNTDALFLSLGLRVYFVDL